MGAGMTSGHTPSAMSGAAEDPFGFMGSSGESLPDGHAHELGWPVPDRMCGVAWRGVAWHGVAWNAVPWRA